MKKPSLTHMKKPSLTHIATIILVAFLLGTIIAQAQTPTATTFLQAGSLTETTSYVIWVDGSNYFSKNGETGQIEYASTNATEVIQDSLDALTGGRNWYDKIVIKGSITSTATIDVNNYTKIELVGEMLGSGGTCFDVVNADHVEIYGGKILNYTNAINVYLGQHLYFHDIYSDSSIVTNAASNIIIQRVKWNIISDLTNGALYVGANVERYEGTTFQDITLQDLEVVSEIGILTVTPLRIGPNPTLAWGRNIMIDNARVSHTGKIGVWGGDGLDVIRCIDVTVTNSVMEWCASTGFAFTVKNLKVSGCTAQNNRGPGFAYGDINPAGQDENQWGALFENNIAFTNGRGEGADNYSIAGFVAIGNATEGTTTNHVVFDGNRAYDSGEGYQDFGIVIWNSVDEFIISNNDVVGNNVSAISIHAGAGASRKIVDNLGFITENSGRVAKTTSQVINHGLAGIPTSVVASGNQIHVNVAVSAYDDTDFTVVFYDLQTNSTHGGSVIVSWYAEYKP